MTSNSANDYKVNPSDQKMQEIETNRRINYNNNIINNKNLNNVNLFVSNNCNKNKIANKNIVIIKDKDKENESNSNNSNWIKSKNNNNKNLINILASENSQTKSDGVFSVTMTLYSDQSEIPQTLEFINKTNTLLEKIDGKCDDKNNINKIPKNALIKIQDVIEESENEEKAKVLDNSDIELDNSIRNIFEHYNLASLNFNNKENIEKLGTLHLNDEEAKKLEKFFKNKYSIII